MQNEYTLIFGYGSLMNDESRLSSAPHSQVVKRQVVLRNYERIFNIAYGEYVYANIQPSSSGKVIGVLMEVSPEGLANLRERESKYEFMDVSDQIVGEWDSPVYACVGADNTLGHEAIKQSYIDLCLSGVSEQDREQWLDETIMKFPINKTA